jgi:hypothetical protein
VQDILETTFSMSFERDEGAVRSIREYPLGIISFCQLRRETKSDVRSLN